MRKNRLVLIKGGGDIATGVAHRLVRCGFSVILTEISEPTCIRRTVSFANAIYEGRWTVEGITAQRVDDWNEIEAVLNEEMIPIVTDKQCRIKEFVRPTIIIDAILAKVNMGTRRGDAPIVIGLGPGFEAGKDVDMVIETMRGHHLGKVILQGKARENTGVPGKIEGYTIERLLRASKAGKIKNILAIGNVVKKGEEIAIIEEEKVEATMDGMIRGLIYDGFHVHPGMKIGDIDPRKDEKLIYTISDKARAIAGGVLEGILIKMHDHTKTFLSTKTGMSN